MTTADAPVERSGTPADPAAPGLLARLADRLNPILVREVQQSVNGRLFTITVGLSLAALTILGLVVASEGEVSAREGREYFSVTLSILTPVLLFVLPLQGYLSMNTEIQPGLIEQVTMSRLRPRQVVAGKLMAASVQYLLYLAVFGPALAMTFFLRGVDLPTIVLAIVSSGVACLTATSVAIAAAATSRWSRFQALNYAGITFGLAVLSLVTAVGMEDLIREVAREMRRPEFWVVMSGLALMCLAGTLLMGMIAASILTHAYENRSTPFRVFVLGAVVLAFVWLTWAVPVRFWDDVFPGSAVVAMVGVIVLGLFAVTEERRLSPRVATLVPANRWLALVSAPLLPGQGRGLGFVVLLLVFVAALGFLPPLFVGVGPRIDRDLIRAVIVLGAYAVIFLGLTRLVRGRLPAGARWSMAARLAGPVLLLGIFVPILFDVVVQGRVRDWHWGHLLNPFWTGFDGPSTEVLTAVLAPCVGVVLLLNAGALVTGVSEVLDAAGVRRRQREADAA